MFEHTLNQPEKPHRVVILGGSGFVGGYLKEECFSQGINVLALSSREIDLISPESVAQLQILLEPADCLVVFSALTPDKGKGSDVFIKNILMVKHVHQAVAESEKIAHLVYFSSDAVYAMGNSIVDENTLSSPEDLYGAMHLSRELLFKTLSIPIAIMRPTLIYGTGDTHNSYGPNRFVRQALKENKIPLFGNGEETRSHISVKDVSKIVIYTILRRSRGTLNLVTESSLTFHEVANVVSKLVGTGTEIVPSERKNPPTHRHFNPSELYKAFPEFKETSFGVGMRSMIDAERKQNETGKPFKRSA